MTEKSLAQIRDDIIEWYKYNSCDQLSDEKFVELLICMSCDNCDYKKITKNLFDTFQSLDNIFYADVEHLLNVDGVNENVAVYLSLMSKIKVRISENQNASTANFTNTSSIIEYAKNVLLSLSKERVLFVTVDENKKLIGSHLMNEGNSSLAVAKSIEISKIIISDKPKYAFVAHNHPKGTAEPSPEDVRFTQSLIDWLDNFGVELLDHIIVSPEDCVSLRYNKNFLNLVKWNS